LPLLAGGPADQPPRLRSMADAIAWSHDLLTSAEQTLFRRLAVFVGGFTLDAAEWVAGWQGGRVAGETMTPRPRDPATAPPASYLELLTALVDQSLVQRVPGPGLETRFSMLETVREFGLERLTASGEEALVRDAHADWCLAFAERAGPELAGPRQEMWFDRLETEHPNLRSSLTWLRERGDAERGLRLTSTLSWFWSSRGYLREARAWFDQFLAMPTSAATRGSGLLDAATILQWQGEDERALALNEEALGIFRELGDELNTAYALRTRASIAIDRGDHELAAALLAESNDELLAGPRAWDRPFALYLAGRVAAVAGKSAEAASRFAEAADGFRKVGDHSYVAAALAQQGAAAIGSGDARTARAVYAASLQLADERNEPIWVAASLDGAAYLAHASGNPAVAARLHGAAAAIREMIGERNEPDVALIDVVRTALGEERFAAEWRHGANLPELQAIAEARAILTGSTRRSRSSSRERSRQPSPLTARERDVLRLLVDGLADKEIAVTLGISHSTVSDHVAAIRAKLGVPSRAAATALAVRSGLLSS
jgi:DNA-binding CsgD family transcriptional regulator